VKLSHWQKINSVSDDEKLPVATENAEDILLQKMTFFNFQRKVQCLFQAFLRVGRGNSPPPQKNLQFPPNGRQIVCSRSFFGQYSELQMCCGNFLLVDKKYEEIIRH